MKLLKRLSEFLLLGMTLAVSQVPTNGLVAYYPFNGNANDASGHGINGVVTGATLAPDRFGAPNRSYKFDGINDYIIASNLPLINGPFTYSVWIKVDGNNPSHYLQSFGMLGPEPGQTWNFAFNNNGGSFDLWDKTNGAFQPSFPISDSTLPWTHVVITFGGSTQKAYVNGVLIGSRTVSLPITDGGGRSLMLGILRTDIYSDQTFNGQLDDIRIYDHALTPNEIQFLYKEGIPTISSFSPTSGPIGSSITIVGTDFNASASSNVVYFGGAKATVNLASTNELQVTVPVGASYQAISVTDTVTHLSAFSAIPFSVTFPSTRVIDTNSFAQRVDLESGSGDYMGVAAGDIDGDGKVDIIGSNYHYSRISVLRNSSLPGSLIFDPRVDFDDFYQPDYVAVGDLDGDGKLDIVTRSQSSAAISIHRNTSSPGLVTFAPYQTFNAGGDAGQVAIADIDGDGRPDIVCANTRGVTNISVLRNTSVKGNITFANSKQFNAQQSNRGVAIGDLNSDGKPDLVLTNSGSNTISIFQNISTIGNINFAPKVDYVSGTYAFAVAIGDLDGDLKPDFVVTNEGADSLSLFQNVGSAGNISFSLVSSYQTGSHPARVLLEDINGDGWQDVVVGNSDGKSVSVFKNNGGGGGARFAQKIDRPIPDASNGYAISDLNGDGKPDIIAGSNALGGAISIFRNTLQSGTPPVPTINSAIAGNGQIKIKWNKVVDEDLKRYRIYRSTSPIATVLSDSTIDGNLNDTTRIITGLTNGQTYYFRVTAVDSVGNQSGYSNEVSATPSVLTPLREYNPDTSTVLLLHMNEISGSTVGDASSFGNNGNATGTTVATGRFGKARSFNHQNYEWIKIPSNAGLRPTSEFTLEFWIKPAYNSYGNIGGQAPVLLSTQGPTSLGGYTMIIFEPGRIEPKNDIAFGIHITDQSAKVAYSKTLIDSSQWSHVAGIYKTIGNNAWVQIFINGVKEDSIFISNSSITYQNASAFLYIGNSEDRLDGYRQYWGLIDEVRISNIARTPNEFNLQLPPKNLSAMPNGTTVNLSWQNGGGAVPLLRYRIYRGVDSTNMLLIDSTVSEGYNNSALQSVSTYYYRVSAVDSTGFEGMKSYAKSATTTTPAPPTIISISPTSGPIGTSATIIGTNFNPATNKNVVFFGAVRAVVNSGSSSSLTVTVPIGATFSPLTVTDTSTGLTAYSNRPFVVTFPSSRLINKNSFAAKMDTATLNNHPLGLAIGDIDGDSKADLAVGYNDNLQISVFRNNSAIGFVSFAEKKDFDSNLNPETVAFGDIDGDGKLDLVAVNKGSKKVSVLRNLSTNGNVSFDLKVDSSTGELPFRVAVGDMDGDGKPDLVITNRSDNSISVLRNTSTIGTVSFEEKKDFLTGTYPVNVSVSDVDGDGKPDLAVTNLFSNNFSVFRNTSTSDSISFAQRQNFETGVNPFGLALVDLDGDTKPDLVASTVDDSNVSVFRNTSKSGTVSFEKQKNLIAGKYPEDIAIGDVDGDGKPDFVVANEMDSSVSVFRNTSSIGTISTTPKVDFRTGVRPYVNAIGDIDGDGRPDIVVPNWGSNTLSVLRNTMAPASLAGEYSPDSNTVLLLHMNEPNGTSVYDVSSFSNNGTATGTTVVNGRFGKGRSFNGSSDFIRLAKGIIPSTGDFTVEAWINVVRIPGENHSVLAQGGSGNNFYIDYTPEGNIRVGDSWGGGPNFPFNGWHQIAVSVQSTNAKLYIDGLLVHDDVIPNPNSNDSLFIGRQYSGGQFWNGMIDEVRISNIARSPIEFNLQLPPKNLVATPSGTTVNLSWQNGEGAVPLMRYRIYRGADSTTLSLIDSTTFTFHPNSGLGVGTYFYRISAVDSTGFEGAKSYAINATTSSAPVPGEYFPDTSTVLLLHMNETFGSTVADVSPLSNNGTATGTTIVNGRFGKARNFNGSSDRLTVSEASSLNPTSGLTVEAWVKVTQPIGGKSGGIVSKDDGVSNRQYLLSLNGNNNKFRGHVGLQSTGYNYVEGADTVSLNVWYHVAMTYDGSALKLYVNGKQTASSILNQPMQTTTQPVLIGVINSPFFFPGLIDEVRISNIVRLPNEFNLQLPPINLAATPSVSTINLSWQIGGGTAPLMRYKIYRGADSINLSLIDSTTSTLYANTGLGVGTYYYRVSGVDSTGFEGAKSYAVEATTISPPILGEYSTDGNTMLLLHMNETSGSTTSDASNIANNGTATGTTVVNGRFGKGRIFGSNNDVVDLSRTNLKLTTFTAEAWANLTAYNTNPTHFIFSDLHSGVDQGWLLALDQSQRLNFTMMGQPHLFSSSKLTAGRWYHIAVSYDGSKMKIFLNGVQDTTLAFSGLAYESSSSYPFKLGNHNLNPNDPQNQYFNGALDEVRISNIARSPNEFNLQLPPKNLTANALGVVINLAWQKGGGVAPLMRYRIYRGADSTNISLIDSTNSLGYSNIGLQPLSAYYYRVSAVDSTGFEGAKSYAVKASTGSQLLLGEYSSDANTVLLLHMNETSGSTLADASGQNNNATGTGTTILNGRFGKARGFNGTSDRADIANENQFDFINGDFTVEGWVKPTDIAGIETIFSKYNSFTSNNTSYRLLFVSGKLSFEFYNAPSSSNNYFVTSDDTVALQDTWHHYAAVINSTSQKVSLFRDGVELRSTIFANIAFPTSRNNSSDPLRIGVSINNQNLFTEFLSASVDEVRISNIARLPNEFNLQLPPKNLTANTSGTTINLSWQKGGGAAPLMRYKIYRGTDSTVQSLIDSTTLTSFPNSGLVNGAYFYRVSAVDSTSFEGAKSYAVRATVLSVPSSPLTVVASGVSTTQIDLSWSASAAGSPTLYRIQRSLSSGSGFSKIDSVGGGLTTYSNTALTPSTVYWYRVTAVNAAGESSSSNEDSARTFTPADPFVSLSTTTLSYGSVVPGTSSQKSLTIANVGGTTLTGTVSVTENAGFSKNKTVVNISAGSSDSIIVTFSPTAAQNYNATLSIAHNAVGSPSTISLAGTGQSAPGTPSIALSQSSLLIVSNGTTSVVGTSVIIVTNNGTQTLTGTISFSGISFVSMTSSTALNVAPGGGATSIILSPNGLPTIGTFSGLITITHNAPGGSTTIPVTARIVSIPSTIDITKTITFANAQDPVNYQLVGVPGTTSRPATSVLAGEYQKDWRMYRDNGAATNFLEEYDGTATYNFGAGKGFWVLSRKEISLSGTTTNPTPPSGSYPVTLQNGWNIISNPFEKTVKWDDVSVLNRLQTNEVLYEWKNGVWDTAKLVVPFKAYYFNNISNNATVSIPYDPSSALGKVARESLDPDNSESHLSLSLRFGGIERSRAYLGFDLSASDGYDDRDYPAPPNSFASASIVIENTAASMPFKRLFIEHRKMVGDGQQFTVLVRNGTKDVGSLAFDGINTLATQEIYVVDEKTSVAYDPKQTTEIAIPPSNEEKRLTLFVGPAGFVSEIHARLQPKDFALRQNYPNPFNPSTTLIYGLPVRSNVRLTVYNVLGQIVAQIVDATLDAGWNQVIWNANVASGMYFYRLEAVSVEDPSTRFIDMKKLIVLK